MKELKIKMLLIHTTQNCNSPCIMCDCWKTQGKVELNLNDLSNTIDIFSDKGGELVMISGGEPTLHKGIKEILSYCKNKKLQVAFNTNGILLRKKVDEILPLSDFIIFSIDAGGKELYKKIRGVDALDKIISNVNYIQLLFPNVKIQFRCTISRLNLFNFLDVIKLAEDLKISGVGFSPIDYDSKSFSRLNNNLDINFNTLIPNEDEIRVFEESLKGELGGALQKYFDRKIITWNLDYFNSLVSYFKEIRSFNEVKSKSYACFFPYTSVLVDYDGSLKGCFYSKPFTSIHEVTNSNFIDYNRIKAIEREDICFNCRGRIFT